MADATAPTPDILLIRFPPLYAEILAAALRRRHLDAAVDHNDHSPTGTVLLWVSHSTKIDEDDVAGARALVAVTQTRYAERPTGGIPLGAVVPVQSTPDELASVIEALQRGHKAPIVAGSATPKLTPREVEVMELVATGKSNREIGTRLGISTHTVRSHLERVMEKLTAKSRVAAVVKLRESGVLGPWQEPTP